MFLLALLSACDGNKFNVGDDTGETEDTDTADDTGGPDDTGSGQTGDVEGPSLPDCTPQTGSGDDVALSGVILTTDGPVAGVVVYSRSTGTISCVGASCDTTGAEVVCTEGIVSPGLIDAHNHLQYNTLPPWQVDPTFEDRYEWQRDDGYQDFKSAYNDIKDEYLCEIMKWAEARELVHGTTAAVGSSGGSCIDVLIRNLDEDSDASGLDGYEMIYGSSNVTDALDSSDGTSYTGRLQSGSLDAVLQHVAEGKNGSVRDEIDYMSDIGMVGPGQAFVHTADASTEQLATMAATGTGIVWSPRSNLALYATTTPIEIAEKLGVPWAIGTDWTPSGSMAPTKELACAAEWLQGKGNPLTDRQLWEKSTTDAARIVGLDGVLGTLAEGYRADIAVFTWDRHPYRRIIEADPQDTRLVVVNGAALYGTTGMVATLAEDASWCDALDVCGEGRSICAKAGESGDDAQTLSDVESELTTALANASAPPSGYEYAAELYPLYACTDDRASCDLREPTSSDADGDGVADGEDLCPDIYDPLQWDTDGDGEGDDCDDCPMQADTSDCEGTTADIDGDGVGNDDDNCPFDANEGQEDGDGDGTGDVCDACPDEPNTATEGCSTTIDAIRDPSHPDHPADGDRVRVSGVVVTAVRDATGFFVQDPALSEYGGVFVYDRGANTVTPGDVVEVDGNTVDYNGLTELESPTVSVTGTADVPTPIDADPCDVGTGGSLAEAYESMLVRLADVSVTDANPDDPNDYDEFEVGSCLRVDDYVWQDLDQPAEGTTYSSITGVLMYSFENSKIAPRDDADLVEG